jgi:hypothetical protein
MEPEVRTLDRHAWALWHEGRVREAVQHWSELAIGLRRTGRLGKAHEVGRALLTVTADAAHALRLTARDHCDTTAVEEGAPCLAGGHLNLETCR